MQHFFSAGSRSCFARVGRGRTSPYHIHQRITPQHLTQPLPSSSSSSSYATLVTPSYHIVIVDVESTGLSTTHDTIIEIAASKLIDGHYIGSFSSLIHFHGPLPLEIKRTTNITEEMLSKAPKAQQVLSQFVQFVGDSVMMAHNASFDYKMIFNELSRHRIDLPPCFAQLATTSSVTTTVESSSNHVEEDDGVATEFKVVATNVTSVMPEQKNDIVVDSSSSSSSSSNSSNSSNDESLRRRDEAEQIGCLCTLLLARRLMPEVTSHKLGDLLSHMGKPQPTAHRALPDTQATMYLWRHIERNIYSRLGFYPPVSFYKQLCSIKSSHVDTYIKNYKALHGTK